MLALLTNRYAMGLAGLLACVVAIHFYGQIKYREGARETVQEFVEGDLRNAAQVREKAREVLDSLGGNVDVDELLRSTGGLRD